MKKLVIALIHTLWRWLLKLFTLIIWPIRHWKISLIFLLILLVVGFLLPLANGVKLSNIPSWYKAKITHPFVTTVKNNMQNLSQLVEQKITQSTDAVKDKVQNLVPEIVPQAIKEQPTVKEDEPIRLTAWNVMKFNKTKYKQNQQPTQRIKLKAPTFAELKEKTAAQNDLQNEKTAETPSPTPQESKQTESYYEGKLADYYTVRHDLDLVYLTETEKLYGQVDVVGPNSLYINDTYVYLYGIYTNPDIYNEQSAQLYLEKLIDNQPVHCDVIAYSVQSQTPTALCFLNGKLLNQELVDAEYAANIALK